MLPSSCSMGRRFTSGRIRTQFLSMVTAYFMFSDCVVNVCIQAISGARHNLDHSQTRHHRAQPLGVNPSNASSSCKIFSLLNSPDQSTCLILLSFHSISKLCCTFQCAKPTKSQVTPSFPFRSSHCSSIKSSPVLFL